MLQLPLVKLVNESICVTGCLLDVYTAPAGHGSRRLIDTLACFGGNLVRPLQLQLQYRQSAPINGAGLRASVAPHQHQKYQLKACCGAAGAGLQREHVGPLRAVW